MKEREFIFELKSEIKNLIEKKNLKINTKYDTYIIKKRSGVLKFYYIDSSISFLNYISLKYFFEKSSIDELAEKFSIDKSKLEEFFSKIKNFPNYTFSKSKLYKLKKNREIKKFPVSFMKFLQKTDYFISENIFILWVKYGYKKFLPHFKLRKLIRELFKIIENEIELNKIEYRSEEDVIKYFFENFKNDKDFIFNLDMKIFENMKYIPYLPKNKFQLYKLIKRINLSIAKEKQKERFEIENFLNSDIESLEFEKRKKDLKQKRKR